MATIIVKTPAEFRDAHVTIEIRADQNEVPEISQRLTSPLSGRLYTAEEVGNAQAGEAEMIAAPLRRRITELERMLVASNDRESKLETERDALLLKVEGYNLDRHTEKQRADENREWAERTEALLENVTTERDALRLQIENSSLTPLQLGEPLGQARVKLTRIQDKVWKGTLDFAMNHRGEPASIPVETVGDLANTVSAVRSIVGQP